MLSRLRNREISRLEGFSDGVFAFAATLLVVSLQVPGSFSELISQLYGFFGFAVTFGALVAIWAVHNAFFRRYAMHDGWTVFLNSALLFVVLFYVFPLKFLTDSLVGLLGVGDAVLRLQSREELRQIFMLYSAGFGAIFLCVSLLYAHAWRSRQALELSAEAAWEAATLARHYLLFVVVSLLSVLIAAIGLGVGFGLPGLVYLLLGPLCFAQGIWSERFRPG